MPSCYIFYFVNKVYSFFSSLLHLLQKCYERYIIIKMCACQLFYFTQKIRSFFLLKYSSCKSLNFLQELYLSTSFYLVFYNVTISPSSSQRSCQSFAPCHKNTCPFTRRFPFSSVTIFAISSSVSGSSVIAFKLLT